VSTIKAGGVKVVVLPTVAPLKGAQGHGGQQEQVRPSIFGSDDIYATHNTAFGIDRLSLG